MDPKLEEYGLTVAFRETVHVRITLSLSDIAFQCERIIHRANQSIWSLHSPTAYRYTISSHSAGTSIVIQINECIITVSSTSNPPQPHFTAFCPQSNGNRALITNLTFISLHFVLNQFRWCSHRSTAVNLNLYP